MTRRFITTLLIIMLTLSGATRALAAPRDDDRVRTPEEEREARELAVSFLKRLRETDDFSTVTSDLLPSDFGERIKEFIRSENSDSEFSLQKLARRCCKPMQVNYAVLTLR